MGGRAGAVLRSVLRLRDAKGEGGQPSSPVCASSRARQCRPESYRYEATCRDARNRAPLRFLLLLGGSRAATAPGACLAVGFVIVYLPPPPTPMSTLSPPLLAIIITSSIVISPRWQK